MKSVRELYSERISYNDKGLKKGDKVKYLGPAMAEKDIVFIRGGAIGVITRKQILKFREHDGSLHHLRYRFIIKFPDEVCPTFADVMNKVFQIYKGHNCPTEIQKHWDWQYDGYIVDNVNLLEKIEEEKREKAGTGKFTLL